MTNCVSYAVIMLKVDMMNRICDNVFLKFQKRFHVFASVVIYNI